jgi:hypothetical protein
MLAVMPERRMANVVDQRSREAQARLNVVGAELGMVVIHLTGDRLCNLRHLKGVRQAVAEKVRFMAWEELRLSL